MSTAVSHRIGAQVRFSIDWVSRNVPWAPAPRAWTTRSGIRSWSKCMIFSRRWKSSSSVGPRSPTRRLLSVSSTGTPWAVVSVSPTAPSGERLHPQVHPRRWPISGPCLEPESKLWSFEFGPCVRSFPPSWTSMLWIERCRERPVALDVEGDQQMPVVGFLVVYGVRRTLMAPSRFFWNMS